jgi:hypothetical protein
MNVFVSFVDRHPSESIAWFARRSLTFALDRFAPRIREVALRVRDENGPRGGVDQRCSLEIKLLGASDVHLHDIDASAEKCVHRLAQKASRLLSKLTHRRKGSRR